jgi:hypothetical protein
LIACGDNQGLPHEDKESMAHNIGGSVRHYRQPMDGDGIEVGG